MSHTVSSETRQYSIVDLESGALLLKKGEEWLNTFTVVVSYILRRCNTDVTCLLSGPMVRAVIAYVTDYITKQELKAYTYWWSYVRHVTDAWGEDTTSPDGEVSIDKVSIRRQQQSLVSYQKLDDYVHRPTELEKMCLADFLRYTDAVPIAKRPRSKMASDLDDIVHDDVTELDGDGEMNQFEHVDLNSAVLKFQPQHSKARSHAIMFVRRDKCYVLNYVGRVLPRVDHRELSVMTVYPGQNL